MIIDDMAAAQAIGLCVLARQRGLPAIPLLRSAVVNLHEFECDWCFWPVDDLLVSLMTFNAHRTTAGDRQWESLPAAVKGRLIREAAGGKP